MSGYTRDDVTFDSHGTACAAWLYRPTGATTPPVIVMAHGFAAMRALRLDAYAARFAEAGYAVLVFDYRGWGDSAGEPRRVLDIRAQQLDWRAAVAYARELGDVDTSRVVLWGTSFGGGHALHLAAEDHDVAAVIAQVPHISGPASAFSQPPSLVARLISAGVRDQVRALVGRQPYRVPAAGYPGEVAMMTSPDAAPMAIRLAGDRYEELLAENDVAARIALRVPFYSPGRRAHRITAPTLVQIAERDTVTPFDVALKAAQRIPKGEIRTYDCLHFEPYLDPYFDTVVADQITFLAAHVPAAQR
ncbi:pimeloyl-ACP methyl ester carboxylesterase [Nocardioides thalensis]|uniref:Pimeloyl-ACP methyl ester carboxylesterase n=1 Tax=Nocardioides thalensis TaxID=1914755 RepID=A0A853C456_9ACTN|nr:alpha/beta fold hydrolase [Nocardioides thalensis]NYJ01472.1 pimeloyl-ACP methyl ester carboxylesterase [Nocardioides thalensis]